MLKPSRWDALAVALFRISGAAVALFLCLSMVLDWLYVFMPDVHAALLYRLFGLNDVLLDSGDEGLHGPLVWYAGAAGTVAMIGVAYYLARRDRRFVWSVAWCLCCTWAMSMLVYGCYRLALGHLMTWDSLVSTIWATHLLAYGAGWALGWPPIRTVISAARAG